MIRIRIIVVDRTRSPFLAEGQAFYLKRLQHYAEVEWVEGEVLLVEGDSEDKLKMKEDAQFLLKKCW